jgi:hypothetical protein
MDMRTLIALLMLIGALETKAQLITRAQLVPLSNYVAAVESFAFGSSNYFASLGTGTNHLVQTNGVTVGTAGTVNWTAGVTGYVSSGVVHLGVSASGGGGGDVTTAQLNAASNVLRTDITALQGATNGLHARAGNLEGATNGLHGRVGNLEGATNGLRADVLNLQGGTNGLDARLTVASNALRGDIVNLQGATNGLHTRAGNLEGATNGLRADVLNLQGATNGLRTDVLNLQGGTNGLHAGLGPWSNLTTNKVVTTNDQWFITRGSNGVVVAAGAGISVASSGASGQQTFTVSATGGGSPGGNSGAIQFNEGGGLAGTNEFLFDRTNKTLSVVSNIAGYGLTATGTVSAFAGSISNLTATNINVRAGRGASNAWVGGVIYVDLSRRTNHSTVSSFTNLSTFTVPAHTLTNNGDTVTAEWAGVMLSGTNRFFLGYGSITNVLDLSGNTNGHPLASWKATLRVTRAGDTEQRVFAEWMTSPGFGIRYSYTNREIALLQTNGVDTLMRLQGAAIRAGGITNDFLQVRFDSGPR